MNLLNEIKRAGLVISLEGDRLKVENTSHLTEDIRNQIRNNRAEIIRQLSKTKTAVSNELLQDIREQVEERAAIMEYDGGLTRKDAERAAINAIRVYCYRVNDKPNSELVAIMPNTELHAARESLKDRYGDRLLDVYPSPYCMSGADAGLTKH